MAVLSYTNAFPGIPAPQHLAGQTSVQSFLFPGAVQPQVSGPAVLTAANAFPGIAAPQHLAGQSVVRSFLFPGALQPLSVVAPSFTLMAQIVT